LNGIGGLSIVEGVNAPLLEELSLLAETVARRAGEMLMQRPRIFDLNQKGSARDFATQMDHASESLIVRELLSARPRDGMIGEEGASRATQSGITWVIDPLDGTVNYFYGLPGWNVSIAAKDETGVLVGAVVAPTIQSVWTASRGCGAYLNGQRISVNDPVRLDRALLGTGFSYDSAERVGQSDTIRALIPKVRDIRRMGAAAVDLCFVAMGALDGFFEMNLKEWDMAAGGLMVTEAGGIVTVCRDGKAHSEMLVASGAALHPELLAEIGLKAGTHP
jgi:myo-inositol-1(or 4)-monophosphatase